MKQKTESKPIIGLMMEYPEVESRLKDVLVSLIAKAAIKDEFTFNSMLNDVFERTGNLDMAVKHRTNTVGLEAVRANSEVTKAIAELQLQLDIMSKVFTTQNINSHYKDILVEKYNEVKDSFDFNEYGVSFYRSVSNP